METLAKTPVLTKWNLDSVHSNLEFSVKHMMISTVKGSFKDFNVNLESASDDFSNAKIEADIQIDGIHTGQENREAHLKSPDFFDAANFPAATFKSTSIEKADDEGTLKVYGDLTIKGTTKPVTLTVNYNGIGTDPYGNVKAGFDFSTSINRADFGLSWNVPLEAGGVMVSNTVKIFGGLQFAKQKEA